MTHCRSANRSYNTVTAIDVTLQVYQNPFVMALDHPVSFDVKSNKYALGGGVKQVCSPWVGKPCVCLGFVPPNVSFKAKATLS